MRRFGDGNSNQENLRCLKDDNFQVQPTRESPSKRQRSFKVSTRVGNKLGVDQPIKAWTAMIVSLAYTVMIGLIVMALTTSMRYQ